MGDLSHRLNLPIEQITIIEISSEEWNDSGLGCPFPGVEYSPGPIAGLLIHLEVDQELYSYHTDLTGRIILCGKDGFPQMPVIPITPGEIQDGVPWMPVDP